MSTPVDVEKVKRIFTEANCPGILEMIDYLVGEEPKGLERIVLVMGPEVSPFDLVIGDKGKTPFQFFEKIALELPPIDDLKARLGLAHLDKVCAEFVAATKATSRPMLPEEEFAQR